MIYLDIWIQFKRVEIQLGVKNLTIYLLWSVCDT